MRLDWLGCTTFRFVLGELVVYLDAYIDRVPSAPKTGVTVADVNRADWIVVGHSHFDHLWGAERVARQTGATIVGSYESIRIMAELGVPTEQLMPVSGGERIKLTDDVTVGVYPSLHSCIWTHARFAQSGEVCSGDLGVVHQDRLARLGVRPKSEIRGVSSGRTPFIGWPRGASRGVAADFSAAPLGQQIALEGKQRRFDAGADVDLAIDVFQVVDGVLA